MAKALKIVGTVVAVVAIAASAIATGGGTLAAGFATTFGATAGMVATYAGLAAGLIGVVSAFAFKPPGFSGGGNPQNFTTNPQSGLPYCIGRTAMSGLRAHGDTTRTPSWTKFDDMLAFAVLLSAGGAIQSIDQFTADKEVVAFDGSGNATGRYVNYMGQKTSLGTAGASALALSLNSASFPGWTSAHKLSGMTHALWMLRYDSNGNLYTGGVPEPRWVGKWVKVYDPRLDSTYPGGSGSCRALNEATYVWSRNPALHALTWCLGRWQNGQRTLGIGAPIASIRVGDFVSAANIADANHWCAGGVTWSTEPKWNVLKGMLQAGGAVPTMTGAMIGCRVFTPRVSIATIRSADLLDSLTIPAAKSRRERINTVIPRYRSEDHDWEIVSGTPVSVSAYVTADGGKRSREVDFPFVQNETGQSGVDGIAQAGHLAAYEIVNAREAGPISFTTGPAFIGLKCGDCITLDVPEEGLSNQKIVLTSDPVFDPASGKITFAADTETDSKHTFALGQASTPPPAFSLSAPDLIPPQPTSGVWSLAHALGSDGLPLLRVAGSTGLHGWDGVLVEYRRVGDTSWTLAGSYRDNGSVQVDITAVDGATAYEARVAYYNGSGVGPWRDLSAVTTDAIGVTADIPLGSNLVINSDFTGGLTGFSAGWDGTAGRTIDRGLNLSPSWSGVLNVAHAHAVGTAPAAGTVFDGHRNLGLTTSFLDSLKQYAVPVLPGDRLYFSMLAAGHRCTCYAILIAYDSAGTEISEASTPATTSGNFAGGDPANAQRIGAFWDMPANARYAMLETRALCPGGSPANDDPYMFWAQPFIAKVAPGQTTPPPYTSGPPPRDANLTADWPQITSIPYDDILNNDDSTTLGFNGSFESWAGAYPDGWGVWTGTPPYKEASIVRYGTKAAKYDCAGANIGMVSAQTWYNSPMPSGTICAGNIDFYLSARTSGLPGILVDLATDATFSTYVRHYIQPTLTTTGVWQTVPWIARVGAAQKIYGIQIYVMGSWAGLPSGAFTGTAIFDRLNFAFFNGGLDNSQVKINADGSLSGGGGGSVTISGLGYTGALDATKGAPSGTNVGSTPATTVEAGGNKANSGLDASGNVLTDKVSTPAINNNAVTKRYAATLGSAVTLTNLTDVTILSVSITKDDAASDVDIDCDMDVYSSDDIRGTFYIKRDGTTIKSKGIFMNGGGGTYRVPIHLYYLDAGASAGSHTYSISFIRNGGASTVIADVGSSIRCREIKK